MSGRTFERILIVGSAGTGKTYTAKRTVAGILEGREAAGLPSRLVVFDPLAEWFPAGATRTTSRKEFLRALETGRFPLVVQAVFEDWSPLESLRNLVVVADEMHNYSTAHAIHPSQRKLLCESRHFSTDVVLATQRARHLNPVVMANATRAMILPIQHGSDRRAISEGLGVDLPAPSAWRPVPGCSNPRAREPIIWPDGFDGGTMDGDTRKGGVTDEREEEDDGTEGEAVPA